MKQYIVPVVIGALSIALGSYLYDTAKAKGLI